MGQREFCVKEFRDRAKGGGGDEAFFRANSTSLAFALRYSAFVKEDLRGR